jgi:hypothetical protein
MEITAGFYKLDNGTLLYAPNYVLNKDYELHIEYKNNYTYPFFDWYFFEREDDALIYFGIDKQIL